MLYPHPSCVDACTSCISIAAHCAQACIDEGRKKCATYCFECVEICKTMTVLAARDSVHIQVAAQACATICEGCAEECEKHANDHCRACAEACRHCAAECRNIIKA